MFSFPLHDRSSGNYPIKIEKEEPPVKEEPTIKIENPPPKKIERHQLSSFIERFDKILENSHKANERNWIAKMVTLPRMTYPPPEHFQNTEIKEDFARIALERIGVDLKQIYNFYKNAKMSSKLIEDVDGYTQDELLRITKAMMDYKENPDKKIGAKEISDLGNLGEELDQIVKQIRNGTVELSVSEPISETDVESEEFTEIKIDKTEKSSVRKFNLSSMVSEFDKIDDELATLREVREESRKKWETTSWVAYLSSLPILSRLHILERWQHEAKTSNQKICDHEEIRTLKQFVSYHKDEELKGEALQELLNIVDQIENIENLTEDTSSFQTSVSMSDELFLERVHEQAKIMKGIVEEAREYQAFTKIFV